jgi:hypothetical protein
MVQEMFGSPAEALGDCSGCSSASARLYDVFDGGIRARVRAVRRRGDGGSIGLHPEPDRRGILCIGRIR